MLKEHNLFGVTDKIKIAIERLQMFEPDIGYYLAFSGGKDSIVLYHLAETAKIRFDAHYNNTTIDPPELVNFIRKVYPAVINHKPEKSFFQLIPKRGIPMRTQRWCCEELKERFHGKNRVVLTGIRWAESNRRKKRKMVEQCFRTKTKSFLHPIIDWTDRDIWDYISMNKIPYCKLYDQGFKRIGCIMCPMAGKTRKIEAERYPNFVKAYKLAFKKLLSRLRSDNNEWALKFENENDLFNWWIDDNRNNKQNNSQLNFVLD